MQTSSRRAFLETLGAGMASRLCLRSSLRWASSACSGLPVQVASHQGRRLLDSMHRALFLVLLALPLLAADPFVGDWALTSEDGGAVWLGVDEKAGQLSVGLMWRAGGIRRAQNPELSKPFAMAAGERPSTSSWPRLWETGLTLNQQTPPLMQAIGNRQPPLPPTPDVTRVRWGAPVKLFNGEDLSG